MEAAAAPPPPPPDPVLTARLAEFSAESHADAFVLDALWDVGEKGLTAPEIIKKAVQAGDDAMTTEDAVGLSLARLSRCGQVKTIKYSDRGGRGVWVAVGERPEVKAKAAPPVDPDTELLWLENPVDRFTLMALNDIYVELNGRQCAYSEGFVADQLARELKDRMVGMDDRRPARRIGVKGTQPLRDLLFFHKPPAHVFVRGRSDKWFGPFTESWVRQNVEYHRAVLTKASKRKGDPTERPLHELLQLLTDENGI